MVLPQASLDPGDSDRAILIGLGANLPSVAGAPRDTLEAAVTRFADHGVTLVALSSWHLTTPVPFSPQPLFVNGVAEVWYDKEPSELLAILLRIEAEFGRVRGEANAARTLDLDLLAFGRLTCESAALTLPHPRMTQRLFVLAPLAERWPGWRHPRLGVTAAELMVACRRTAGRDRVEPL